MNEVAKQLTPGLIGTQHNWSLIARDIAMFANPQPGATPIKIGEIAERYSLSLADLRELIKLPAFCKYLQIEVERVKNLGLTAGYIMHSEIITTAMDEILYKDALAGNMDVVEKLKFRNAMAKSAGLEAPIQSKEDASIAGLAVNVNLNIPKLSNPKLEHMFVDVSPAEVE